MVTQRQIAEKLGLTQATVSLSFNRPETVAEATRARVLQAARELGYRTNAAAVAVSTGRFGCVTLLQDAEKNRSALPMDLMNGICDMLAEHDFHLAFAKLEAIALREEAKAPKLLRQMLSDGILLNFNMDVTDETRTGIARQKVPAIWMNVRLENDCVYPDDRQAGHDLTEALLKQGHRRIVYVDYAYAAEGTHYSRRDRVAGYAAAMTEAGVPPRLITAKDRGNRRTVDYWADMLTTDERPTAVIGYSENHLSGTMVAALQHARLRIPQDLALATFEDGPMSLGVPVTTVHFDREHLGRTAVEVLMQKINAPETPLSPCILPWRVDTATPVKPERSIA